MRIDSISFVDTTYHMKTKVARWGNSLALRIPKHLAKTHQLSEGSDLEIIGSDNEIRLRPLQPKRYVLSELLKDVTPANLHTEVFTEPPKGKEIW